MKRTIAVSEIFGPTIQGEGALIGRPTVFVRTGGCDYRCSWCDTLYAVLPEHRSEWAKMEPEAIFREVRRLSGERPTMVTISGGNPAIQPLEPLIELGHEQGYTFALETQGSLAKPWFAKLDYLTISPKPPSSGMNTDWEKLARCIHSAGESTATALKVVVFDDVDYEYARRVNERFPGTPMYLQVGNHTPPQAAAQVDIPGLMERLEWLVDKVTSEGWNDATVLPQLHTLVWGNKRGV
ncbi:MAG: 7-carboxy-7-deazaguanine synthase QueE [Chloroflexota bacterium]|nr:7-carboxy-7-deazaguanine synthase QueE [Chloroflexota bacterium]